MSLTINPAGATLAPTNDLLTGGVSGSQGATSAGASSASNASAALYLNFGLPTVTAGPLGLRSPQNPEDAAALLAEVELALDQTVSQNRNAGIASAFGGAHAALQQGIQAVAAATATLTADAQTLSTDQTNLTSAQRDQAALQQQSTNLGTQIAGLQGVAASLQTQIATAQQNNDPDTAAALTAQLATVNDQIATQTDQKGKVDAQLATATAKVNDLESRINTLETVTIPRDQQAVQVRALALVSAYSQVALTVDTQQNSAEGAVAKGIRLDLGFEDLSATNAKFRDNDVAVVKQSADQHDQQQRVTDEERRVAQLVTGVIAGLSDALDLLRSVTASNPAGGQATADPASDRLRLAL